MNSYREKALHALMQTRPAIIAEVLIDTLRHRPGFARDILGELNTKISTTINTSGVAFASALMMDSPEAAGKSLPYGLSGVAACVLVFGAVQVSKDTVNYLLKNTNLPDVLKSMRRQGRQIPRSEHSKLLP